VIDAGVSFVVPVFNGRRHLRRVLTAIGREAAGRPFEILVVDDGSRDGSTQLVRLLRDPVLRAAVRLVQGPGRGAAAAINAGIEKARFAIVAQIDQDVVLQPGWLEPLVRALDRSNIAAAQGHYLVPRRARFWSRMSGRDLDLRYSSVAGRDLDHVCTGNTVYRKSALYAVGLFNEQLGYGYDNDLSYRLRRHGYGLVLCRDAGAHHFWRDSFRGYLSHQFGVGFGRLDVIRAHPQRLTGDAVSGTLMLLHAPLMLAVLSCAGLGAVFLGIGTGALARLCGATGAVLLAVIMAERALAGMRAWHLTDDRASLWFPIAHLARDAAWAWALVRWTWRRITRFETRPTDSMPRRDAAGSTDRQVADPRVLVLIPAFNEAANLPLVIADVRANCPRADVLIINDASTDGTRELLPSLGTAWLTLPERLGIGGALRAGLKYARRHGYDLVARMDGDGQHCACDLARLMIPVKLGRADAVSGSRYLSGGSARGARGLALRMLAACLTILTGRVVTDPTSGLWMFGPRALQLLGDYHPGGYPEPELRLLLARHGLAVKEVPIRARERHAGRTTLTPLRAAAAFARTSLAVIVTPLRRSIGSTGD
jgi:glycosyltransferase involved in cell wall biosynthesis